MNKNKLAGAIASAGLTQRELAKKIGISKNTFSAKMNGKSFFNTDEIDKICNELLICDNIEKVDIFLQ